MNHIDGKINAFLWHPRNSAWRWLLACAAALSAVAHLPVIGPHLAEAPYMGEEFIVLTVACLLIALAAIICDSAAVYSLGVLTCGLAVVGYVATRLTAFPQLADDVGNWFEPLGVVSVLAESIAVLSAISGLRTGRTPRVPAPGRPAAAPAAPSIKAPVPVSLERTPVSDVAPSWPVWRPVDDLARSCYDCVKPVG